MKLKKSVLTVLFVVIGGCSAVWYLASDPLPLIQQDPHGTRVEQLVDQMWEALNAKAWFEAEGASWTFMGKHHYVWHKHLGRVRVQLSEDTTVYLETYSGHGYALINKKPAPAERQAELIAEAFKSFNNDSFWLAAPFKARDPGTQRSLVNDKEGEGVLVYYQSGGTTPGDRYLWRFDSKGLPKLWQLWVQIIPVKGVVFTWEDWHQSLSGAWIARLHSSALLNVNLQDIKVTRTFAELEVKDPYLTSSQWSELMQ